jgi:hypothetical protein
MTQFGECPSCHTHCLFQKSDSVYMCLGCTFKKDINPTPAKKESLSFGAIATIAIAVFFILSLLGRLRPQPINSNQPSNLSPKNSAIVNPAVASQK